MQFEQDELDQQGGPRAIAAVFEQRQDGFPQQRRHPHDELGIEIAFGRLAREPRYVEVKRAHLDVGQHVDGVFEASGHPHRAAGRHQPTALRRRHLHGAGCREHQLCLAMHVRIEPRSPGI
jgi:hypothetical protein